MVFPTVKIQSSMVEVYSSAVGFSGFDGHAPWLAGGQSRRLFFANQTLRWDWSFGGFQGSVI